MGHIMLKVLSGPTEIGGHGKYVHVMCILCVFFLNSHFNLKMSILKILLNGFQETCSKKLNMLFHFI